jgi:hypothetical protein
MEKNIMKVTLTDFKNVDGDEAHCELAFPDHWNIFIMQFIDTLEKFEENTHLFGYAILLGEPHPEIKEAMETGVYVRVSPNLPDAGGFKRMLMHKVAEVWKEHMKQTERSAYCAATDKEKGEITLDDLTAKGKE